MVLGQMQPIPGFRRAESVVGHLTQYGKLKEYQNGDQKTEMEVKMEVKMWLKNA